MEDQFHVREEMGGWSLSLETSLMAIKVMMRK